jgi:hypothetical protein
MRDFGSEIYKKAMDDYNLAMLFADESLGIQTVDKISNNYPNALGLFSENVMTEFADKLFGKIPEEELYKLYNYTISCFLLSLSLLDSENSEEVNEENSDKIPEENSTYENTCQFSRETTSACSEKAELTLVFDNNSIPLCENHAKEILTMLFRADGIEATINKLDMKEKDFFLNKIISTFDRDEQSSMAEEILNWNCRI